MELWKAKEAKDACVGSVCAIAEVAVSDGWRGEGSRKRDTERDTHTETVRETERLRESMKRDGEERLRVWICERLA